MHIDPDVAAAARRGEPDALDEVIRATYPYVSRLARRMLPNPEDAADAVQETYLKLCRSMWGFKGASGLGTWLHRVTVNTCLDVCRKQAREAGRIDPGDPDAALAAVAERGAGPEALAISAIVDAEVVELLDHLSPALRHVVVLRDLEELDTAAVAALLGITESAVRVRLHRAHQQLAALLPNPGEGR